MNLLIWLTKLLYLIAERVNDDLLFLWFKLKEKLHV